MFPLFSCATWQAAILEVYTAPESDLKRQVTLRIAISINPGILLLVTSTEREPNEVGFLLKGVYEQPWLYFDRNSDFNGQLTFIVYCRPLYHDNAF